MTHILPALAAGASAGGILLFLSHIAPRFGAGNFIRDIDRPLLFGKTITRREAHFVGMFAHLVISSVFGGAFAWLVDAGVVRGFEAVPLLVWSLVVTLLVGGVLMPLEGHGLFGLKEDPWFPVDLVVTNILWAVLFGWLMHLWLGLGIT